VGHKKKKEENGKKRKEERGGGNGGGKKKEEACQKEQGTLRKLHVDSQNYNGVGSCSAPPMGKLQDQIAAMKKDGGAYIILIQETKMYGDKQFGYPDGHLLLTAGKPCPPGADTAPLSSRSSGVGVFLSPSAADDWRRSGSWVRRFDRDVIAVRLTVRTAEKKRPHKLFLISSYAPDSSKTTEERAEHQLRLQAAIDKCRPEETLMVGTDANARLGVRGDHPQGNKRTRDNTVGPFGVSALNASAVTKNIADRARVLLSRNDLCSAATYFKAPRQLVGRSMYHTYTSTNKNLVTQLQLDHIFVRQRDLRKVSFAGCPGWSSVSSDHRRIRITLKDDVYSVTRPKRPGKPDLKVLADEKGEAALEFIGTVLNQVVWPELRGITVGETEVEKVAVEGDAVSGKSGKSGIILEKVMGVLRGALEGLPEQEVVGGKTWYVDAWHTLRPLAEARDAARTIFEQNRNTPQCVLAKAALRQARKNYAKEIKVAIEDWTKRMSGLVNDNGRFTLVGDNCREAWIILRSLASGFCSAAERKEMNLRDPATGKLCETDEDTADVLQNFLKNHHDRQPWFDEGAIDSLPQQPVMKSLANRPSLEEIQQATNKQRNGKSSGEARVPPEAFKCLMRDPRTQPLLMTLMYDVWCSGSYPGEHEEERKDKEEGIEGDRKRRDLGQKKSDEGETATGAIDCLHPERKCAHCDNKPGSRCNAPTDDTRGYIHYEWLVARLCPIPKKGDLSLPKNWRSICLLDILSLIMTSVIASRIDAWAVQNLLDSQNGFRWWRGTVDGLWNVTMALNLRRKAGLTTWAAAVDLRAAFDSVSREALFKIMLKLGFPPHLVNILQRFHKNAKLRFKIGKAEREVLNRAGVRTGDSCGPSLFLLCMHAVFLLIVWPESGKPVFVFNKHGTPVNRMSGGNSEFSMPYSVFADDCFLLFTSREAMRVGVGIFAAEVKRITGMEMHYASEPNGVSKTVGMCFPAPGLRYSDMDTSTMEIQVGEAKGYVSFAPETKYLGSIIHYDLGSARTIQHRIQLATAAANRLRKVLRNKHISLRVRGTFLQATVLTILLYSCESWILTDTLLAKLRTFYHDCCRTAVGTTRRRAALNGQHLSGKGGIFEKLHLAPLDVYLKHRRWGWGGKVVRMLSSRLPNMFLTSRAVVMIQEAEGRRQEDVGGVDDVAAALIEEAEEETEEGQQVGVSGVGDAADDEESAKEDNNDEEKNEERVEEEKNVEEGEGVQNTESANGDAADRGMGTDMGAIPERLDRDETIAPQRHHISVEYAPSNRSKCRETGIVIPHKAIRFKQVIPAQKIGGRSIFQCYSIDGLVRRLGRGREPLRLGLINSLPGLNDLDSEDQQQVRTALASETVDAERDRTISLESGPIQEPGQVPWACTRCGRAFKRSLCWAKKHAQRGDCKQIRLATNRAIPKESTETPGARRTTTWLSCMLREIRKTTSTEDINQEPYPGCRQCEQCSTKKIKQCDRCLLLEWIAAAQDPEEWDKIVYGDIEKDTWSMRRRREKRWKEGRPEEVWVDPRPEEIKAHLPGIWQDPMAARWNIQDSE
jgi:hypothetical protein